MLRKLIVATLLLVLASSATATNILSVQADKVGIGKFVEITIAEGGTVTMIKLSSGEFWVTDDGYLREKVGAGLVRLIAEPNVGYEFDCWIVDGDQENIGNPELEFRTSKGVTSVVAVFVRQTLEIIATASDFGTINGTDWLRVEVEYGAPSPKFVFAPDAGYHISSIIVDTEYISYRESYVFPDPITSDHTITVTFDEVGTATVPSDSNVRMFIDPIASILYNATGGGTVFGTALFIPGDSSGDSSVFFYEIDTTASDTVDAECIGIQLSGEIPENFRVYLGDNPDVLYSDVDGDGDVDITDHVLVANAINSASEPHSYIAEFDVNRDGSLNNYDVLTVNQNMGATLTEIVDWWLVGNTLYFLCDDWSPNCFRGR